MDIFKDSLHISRLEVVETGRRRRWTTEQKLRIVGESFSEPRATSAVARRHGINKQLLFGWRKAYLAGNLALTPVSGFVPAQIVDEPAPPPAKRSGVGRMEIALSLGIRVTVDADVDAAALSRVLAVLEGRPVRRSLGEDR
jgi:transposase